MSESKKERRGARAAAPGAAESPNYMVVASGENVVLVNIHTGQTWAMAHDGGRPIWQPVGFQEGAERAPRRRAARPEEAG